MNNKVEVASPGRSLKAPQDGVRDKGVDAYLATLQAELMPWGKTLCFDIVKNLESLEF